MEYKDILTTFARALNSAIKEQTDPLQVMFMTDNALKGNFDNEDLVEVRGYYKGLKVAREMLRRCCCSYVDNEECSPDCEFRSICRADEEEDS